MKLRLRVSQAVFPALHPCRLKRLLSSAKGFSLETAPCATGLQPRDLPPRHGLLDSSLPILKASFRAFTIAGVTTPYLSSICGGRRGRSCQGRRRNWLPFYQAWNLSPACDGDEQLVEAGRKLYSEGNPEENIVPCVACHGPDAQGIRDIPRLAGLSYYYLKRRLVQWAEGFDPDAKPPMPSVAGKLSAPQIEALASYLSFAQ